ncbi:Putative subunit of the Anaphase Promoting Complex [Ectocarpus siliculosus]|uniref:Anaphase-promoting complex subunit 5 n=1 Tax=Ectocarpus siliculosus TaxID=2880 RepID=D7FTQ0_ECTSI|nr:Putative subunit of the Anaphase Promoting Complex [Ectocarpus siliculosus]|eukprot:CBJ31427.1 Putative subunit of the Anaphase Promoting Complex [Ectocarpus siliculosus]
MYLRPNSVFGVFIRRLKTACDGASFSLLSATYEELVRFTGAGVGGPLEEEAACGSQHIRRREEEVARGEQLTVRLEEELARGEQFIAEVRATLDSPAMDLSSPSESPRRGSDSAGGGFPGEGARIRYGGGSGMGHRNAITSLLRHRAERIDLPGGSLEEKSEQGGEAFHSGGGGGGGGGRREEGGLFPREISAWQLQWRLQRKVLRLENGLSSQVPFEEIESEVQAALGSRSDVPKAHFLRLVNCMHHRELEGSLDSLHRYFDYAVRRGGPSMSNAEGFLDLAKGAQGGSGRHTPQHAALALARLHFEFGHLELASLALGEAIRVAQQSGDKACVAQAMGWLHQRLLVEAGAFERFGYSDMAAACARSVLQIHGDIATASSVELASACIINATLRGKTLPGLPPPPVFGGSAGTPGEERKGDGEEDEQGCVFAVALSIALRQHKEFPHPVSNVWAAGVMVLLHEWMVNRGEFRAAEGWAEAVKAASDLAKLSDTRGLAPQYARLLLELSRAWLGAEPASPVGALPHALRCLAVCESYTLDAIHASAMTHLAQVHLRMGSTRRARILLQACLGQLLASAPVQSQGEAWLAMARCDIAEVSLGGGGQTSTAVPEAGGEGGVTIEGGGGGGGGGGRGAGGGPAAPAALSGPAATGRVRRGEVLRRAVLNLDRAIAKLKRCHDFAGLRECLYLKARVCAELVSEHEEASDKYRATVERNASSREFLAVSKAVARALACPSPGLKIGPAEVRRYMSASVESVPWSC